MQIRINVKGASRKKASIIQLVREYPDTCMTVEEFLAETVRQNVKEYNARKDAGAEKLLAGLLGEQDSVPAGIVQHGFSVGAVIRHGRQARIFIVF